MFTNTNDYVDVHPISSFDVDEIMRQEGLTTRFNNRFSHLIDVDGMHSKVELVDNSQKIPHIFHSIWFTSTTSPREVRESDVEVVISNAKKTKAIFPDRDYILWTNDKKLIPTTIKALEAEGIKVCNTSELGDYKLSREISIALENKEFAKASDIMRGVLIEKFGGLYMDLDYTIYNHKLLADALNKFELVVGKDEFIQQQYFGNAFIAAKPHHPVLEELVSLMGRNLSVPSNIDVTNEKKIRYLSILKDVPDYIKFPGNRFSDTITKTGPAALTIAFYKMADIQKDAGFGAGIILEWPGSGIGLPEPVIAQRTGLHDIDTKTYGDKNFWKDLNFNYSNKNFRYGDSEISKGITNHSYGNNDIGYESQSDKYFHNNNGINTKPNMEKFAYNKIGNDSYGASWVNDNYYNTIDYAPTASKPASDHKTIVDTVLEYYKDIDGRVPSKDLHDMIFDMYFNT